MGNAKSETQSGTIAITAMTVAIFISALWAWFWTHNKQLIDQNALSYPDRVEAFDLDHQRTLESERSNCWNTLMHLN